MSDALTVNTPPALDIDGLTVRFGGALALNRVTLTAPAAGLTGLIGPNGAGKTTTFNACAGVIAPDEGTVRLHGADVSRLGPAARAGLGLGRTFQRMELFGSMTVAENIGVGCEARLAGPRALRQMFSRKGDAVEVAARVDEALTACGLADLAARRVGALSTGKRRLVELARAYAGGFSMLLLDEPSSGLDETETDRVAEVLFSLVARGTGILLVEHDMALVMRVCDYIHVLDFGEIIFSGTPAETLASETVRSAYLGDETGLEAAEQRAGVV
jgi:ABC-type branched-subunit amino acid transport system ATPase component